MKRTVYSRNDIIKTIREFTFQTNFKARSLTVVGQSARVIAGLEDTSPHLYMEVPLWMYKRIFPKQQYDQCGRIYPERRINFEAGRSNLNLFLRVGNRMEGVDIIDESDIQISKETPIASDCFLLKPYGFYVNRTIVFDSEKGNIVLPPMTDTIINGEKTTVISDPLPMIDHKPSILERTLDTLGRSKPGRFLVGKLFSRKAHNEFNNTLERFELIDRTKKK